MFKFESDLLRINLNTVFAVVTWISCLLVSAYFKFDAWYALGVSGIIMIGLLMDSFIWIIEAIWFLPARIHYLSTGRRVENAEQKAERERQEAYRFSIKKDEVNSFVRNMRNA